MKTITLTKGKVAIVDADDYPLISKNKWRIDCNGYAVRAVKVGKTKRHWLRMHRVIAKTPDHLFTDHKNGNKLDNRKSNLRVCTKSQNAYNSRLNKQSHISKFRGVNKHGIKWRACISYEKKIFKLGSFETPEMAALVRDVAAACLHGEFATFNLLGVSKAEPFRQT
jgi:hypothetical protein